MKDIEKKVAEVLFNRRITSMMQDYDIPMSKALLWDWEGFGADVIQSKQDGNLEEDFLYYLWQNNVYGTRMGEIYADVFLGRVEDLVIKKV
jgi:hypothetical protein